MSRRPAQSPPALCAVGAGPPVLLDGSGRAPRRRHALHQSRWAQSSAVPAENTGAPGRAPRLRVLQTHLLKARGAVHMAEVFLRAPERPLGDTATQEAGPYSRLTGAPGSHSRGCGAGGRALCSSFPSLVSGH